MYVYVASDGISLVVIDGDASAAPSVGPLLDLDLTYFLLESA